jgi:hypothetical protein
MEFPPVAAGTVLALRIAYGVALIADLTDVVATAAARHQLRPGSAPATLAVVGGAALVSLAVAVAVDS